MGCVGIILLSPPPPRSTEAGDRLCPGHPPHRTRHQQVTEDTLQIPQLQGVTRMHNSPKHHCKTPAASCRTTDCYPVLPGYVKFPDRPCHSRTSLSLRVSSEGSVPCLPNQLRSPQSIWDHQDSVILDPSRGQRILADSPDSRLVESSEPLHPFCLATLTWLLPTGCLQAPATFQQVPLRSKRGP